VTIAASTPQSVPEGGFRRLLSNYGQGVIRFPVQLIRSFLVVVVRKEGDGN